jgi:hypothetical protein
VIFLGDFIFWIILGYLVVKNSLVLKQEVTIITLMYKTSLFIEKDWSFCTNKSIINLGMFKM